MNNFLIELNRGVREGAQLKSQSPIKLAVFDIFGLLAINRRVRFLEGKSSLLPWGELHVGGARRGRVAASAFAKYRKEDLL